MPRFTLTINCDNAAFEDNTPAVEIAGILQHAAKQILDLPEPLAIGDVFVLRDVNGNTVGHAFYQESIG